MPQIRAQHRNKGLNNFAIPIPFGECLSGEGMPKIVESGRRSSKHFDACSGEKFRETLRRGLSLEPDLARIYEEGRGFSLATQISARSWQQFANDVTTLGCNGMSRDVPGLVEFGIHDVDDAMENVRGRYLMHRIEDVCVKGKDPHGHRRVHWEVLRSSPIAPPTPW